MSTVISAVFESVDLADLAVKHLKDHHIPVLRRKLYPSQEWKREIPGERRAETGRGVERGVGWLLPPNTTAYNQTYPYRLAEGFAQDDAGAGETVVEVTVDDRFAAAAGRMLTSVHGRHIKIYS